MIPPDSQSAAEAASSRRLTEFLLSEIIGIAADAIICLDETQRITLFNDGAEKIFGWRSEEVIGKPLDLLLPERFRGMHHRHVEGFRNSPEVSRKMGQRREIAGLRKSGEEFPAEAAIAKVKMGDTVVYSVVLRDITEQMELHKRLQQAVKVRDDTVGVVAHDLRNPVSAVKMLSQTLLAGHDAESLPAGAREHIQLIRDASTQMDRLIQDLLDVTRVETGRLMVNLQPVTTLALIDAALGTLRPLVEQAGLRLRVNVPATLPSVNADPERIGQVLSNLIGNAIKASETRKPITVAAKVVDDDVEISVTDEGVGIKADDLPHIFDRFWQASPTGTRTRGAGLGLPIARGIVIAHGGRIWAESQIGRGTTVRFTLPFETST
jgi:PAS domain S-box-containing protein